jgi:hypothetical protein
MLSPRKSAPKHERFLGSAEEVAYHLHARRRNELQRRAYFAELLLACHLDIDGIDRAETDPDTAQTVSVLERGIWTNADGGSGSSAFVLEV